jgi:hypothetical protein
LNFKYRIGDSVDRAAASLPKGYTISICVENGAGWVVLDVPESGDYEYLSFNDGDCDLAEEVDKAVAYAVQHNHDRLLEKPWDGGL